MKSKGLRKAVSALLTLTMLLSIMQLDAFAMDYDPSQPSVTDPLDYPLPEPVGYHIKLHRPSIEFQCASLR